MYIYLFQNKPPLYMVYIYIYIYIYTHTHIYIYKAFSTMLDKEYKKKRRDGEIRKHKLNEMRALNTK